MTLVKGGSTTLVNDDARGFASINLRILCARCDFSTPYASTLIRMRDFSHWATNSSGLSYRAQVSAPTVQNDGDPPGRTLPSVCHAKRTLSARVTRNRARARYLRWLLFPRLAMRNARSTTSKCTIHHSCHADPLPSVFPNTDTHLGSHACQATCTSAIILTHASPTLPHACHAKRHSSTQRRVHATTIPHACHAKRSYTRTRRHARDTLNSSA